MIRIIFVLIGVRSTNLVARNSGQKAHPLGRCRHNHQNKSETKTIEHSHDSHESLASASRSLTTIIISGSEGNRDIIMGSYSGKKRGRKTFDQCRMVSGIERIVYIP
jgi:hypothetical protein